MQAMAAAAAANSNRMLSRPAPRLSKEELQKAEVGKRLMIIFEH